MMPLAIEDGLAEGDTQEPLHTAWSASQIKQEEPYTQRRNYEERVNILLL